MRLTIAIEALDAIREAATASRDEVCGLLLGEGLRIAQVVPCTNVAADPGRFFELDPVALFAAHRAARDGGPGVIGHYHSHPTGVARPSPRDATAAVADGSIWLIAGGGEVTAWRAVAGGALHGCFDPLVLDACTARIQPPQGTLPPVEDLS